MSNVWARVSNGLVREVIYFDPQGDFTPDLTWVQVSNSVTTGGNVSGGNVYVVQPRWAYDGAMFTAPPAPTPLPRPASHATYVNHFAFTGRGSNVWLEIANVSIIADGKTAHFLNYSIDVYDANLQGYTTQIIIPTGNTDGGTSYGGGAELAGELGDVQAAGAAAGQDGETGGSPSGPGNNTGTGADSPNNLT